LPPATGGAEFEARAIIVGTLGGFVGWVSWAALTYLLGTHLLPESQTRSNVGELLRTLASAASPGILRVVGAVPPLGWAAFAVTYRHDGALALERGHDPQLLISGDTRTHDLRCIECELNLRVRHSAEIVTRQKCSSPTLHQSNLAGDR